MSIGDKGKGMIGAGAPKSAMAKVGKDTMNGTIVIARATDGSVPEPSPAG